MDKATRDTVVRSACRAGRASLKCALLVDALMLDGIRRNDYEIYLALRYGGYIKSEDTIRHGREAIEKAGLIRDSGERREPKREGKGWGKMIVWEATVDGDASPRPTVVDRLPRRISISLTATEASEVLAIAKKNDESPADVVHRALGVLLSLHRQKF